MIEQSAECREVYYLPLTDPPYLAAARYLALLVYPDIDDNHYRDELVQSFGAATEFGFVSLRQNLKTAERPRLRRRDVDARLAKAERVINQKRLPAAHAALKICLTKLTAGTALQITAETRRTEIAKFLAEETGIKKAYDQVWTPTLPVMHLAIILHSSLQATRCALLDLVHDPAWVEKAVQTAEGMRIVLLDTEIVCKPKNRFQKLPQVQLLFEY